MLTKNLGLSKKHLYANGSVTQKIPAETIKVYLHVGIKESRGKNIGVPAHIIVNIFIEIDRNLIAEIYPIYI